VSEKIKILHVEDSATARSLLLGMLAEEPYHIEQCEDGQGALASLEQNEFDLILLDLGLPDFNGTELMKIIFQHHPDSQIIVITSDDDVSTVVEVMQLGAFDFITKPLSKSRLIVSLKNACKQLQLNHLVNRITHQIGRNQFCNFIGESLPMQAVYQIIENAAPSTASAFITGESGTGKELCAEALHLQSKRSDKAFIPINCAAIPSELMESEIFGHVKGAFTGAKSDREGAATMADGGTLFLDEICEMDYELQSKLLRFIQTGKFQKVGSNKVESVDIRFVCATNRDPLEEIKERRFREDLYYRLAVIPIELPPLRERGNDIQLIAEHFMKEFSKLEDKPFTAIEPLVIQQLKAYHWPGNIRELQNVIRNIVVLNSGETVTFDMLPPNIKAFDLALSAKYQKQSDNKAVETSGPAHSEPYTSPAHASPIDLNIHSEKDIRPLADIEREVIEQAVSACKGNVSKAAGLLGVSPSTIYRKAKNWPDSLINA